jgi:type I restriction enzyme S subunit
VPPIDILENYDSFMTPVLELKQSLHNQNQNLKQTRDMLIPKLVNGEIAI